MTLKEAIESGKPFRRPGYETFYIYDKDTDAFIDEKNKKLNFDNVRASHAIATDWEVKNEPMTVWINIYEDTSIGGSHLSRKDAEAASRGEGIAKKFIEVIE